MSFNKPTPIPTIAKLKLADWKDFLVGTFKKADKSIEDSISNTILRFEKLTPNFKKSSKVLILTEGHTFFPIFIASKYGSKLTVMCRSEEVAKQVLKDAKQYEVEDLITAEKRDFNLTQFDYDQFDMAWSIGALYHKEEELMPVLREIKRILVPQGRFILCEMTSEDEEVQTKLGVHSMDDILRDGSKADLEKVYLKELTAESKAHYNYITENVGKAGAKTATELADVKSWVDADKLAWTFIQLQKRNA